MRSCSLAGLAVGMGMVFVAGSLPAAPPAAEHLEKLPPLVLRSLDGKYVYLSKLCYPGKEKPWQPRSPVSLYFTSSQCVPCRKSLPVYDETVKEYTARGLRAFAVYVDSVSDRANVDKSVAFFQLKCEVLLDGYQKACGKLGVESVPRIVVVGEEGNIVAFFKPEGDYAPQFKEALAKVVPPVEKAGQ